MYSEPLCFHHVCSFPAFALKGGRSVHCADPWLAALIRLLKLHTSAVACVKHKKGSHCKEAHDWRGREKRKSSIRLYCAVCSHLKAIQAPLTELSFSSQFPALCAVVHAVGRQEDSLYRNSSCRLEKDGFNFLFQFDVSNLSSFTMQRCTAQWALSSQRKDGIVLSVMYELTTSDMDVLQLQDSQTRHLSALIFTDNANQWSLYTAGCLMIPENVAKYNLVFGYELFTWTPVEREVV